MESQIEQRRNKPSAEMLRNAKCGEPLRPVPARSTHLRQGSLESDVICGYT